MHERKINLDDDFIKFIRFAQWRIERTGQGILGFITNNTYIDGLTHRRMRQSLLETFDEIYIFDLHGSTRKKETTPEGGKDENVFDIQQGVAIMLAIKKPIRADLGENPYATVHHASLWGLREKKYAFLQSNDAGKVGWMELQPQAPDFFFVPKDLSLQDEYYCFLPLEGGVFEHSNAGIQTKNDGFVYHFDKNIIEKIIKDFQVITPQELKQKYDLSDEGNWSIVAAKKCILGNQGKFVQVHYHPFDKRWTYYIGTSAGWMAHALVPR